MSEFDRTPEAPKPRQLKLFIHRIKKNMTPNPLAWRGAAWGLLSGLTLLLVLSVGWMLWAAGPLQTVAGVLVALAVAAGAAAIISLLITLLGKLPFLYRLGLAISFALTALLGLLGAVYLIGIGVTALLLVIGFSFVGAGIFTWKQSVNRWKRSVPELMVGGILLTVTFGWLASPGTPLERYVQEPHRSTIALPPNIPDPSQPGNLPVQSLCYGSLHGRQIDLCQEPLQIITEPVDGTPFVQGWSSLRKTYWGFGPDQMPLNARVWFPEGQGPFPLVIIVHGNAPMEKPSHGGYTYLAELLASRGFIVAAVDQNFLNLSFFSNLFVISRLEEENDARGWLLLEHLRLWHTWNENPSSPFYEQVDLDQIALIGHSRGGEAIMAAAAFNKMLYYPDDARVAFDYGYSIQALAAIAPVDGQYKPGGRGISVQDVNYLALQGAHDMDVISYMASKQYERIHFSGDNFYFKTGLYIDGANHGQFNTSWGRKDSTEPVVRFFNLAQLMPADDQMQIAKLYLTAFLETTLHEQDSYLPLFRDAQAVAQWLPQGLFINQYADSNTQVIGDFEEDVDPSTSSLTGGSLRGRNLTVWNEKPMPARWGSSENRVVYLGWRSKANPVSEAEQASYEIMLPSDLAASDESVLVFSMAGTNEDPCPDEACRKGRPETYQPPEIFDMIVEVMDRSGQTAQLPLSSFAALHPPLETRLAKSPFHIILSESEIVLKYYEFPLTAFQTLNPALDSSALKSVRLVFNQTEEGVIVLDHIGLRQGGSSLLAASSEQ